MRRNELVDFLVDPLVDRFPRIAKPPGGGADSPQVQVERSAGGAISPQCIFGIFFPRR
ncbi:MAG TPA: hypothetical protein VIX85_08890 [Acidimicrobiales bacterium]